MSRLPCATAQSHKGLFRSQNTSVMYMNVAGKSLTFRSRTIIISCGSSFEHPCMRTVVWQYRQFEFMCREYSA